MSEQYQGRELDALVAEKIMGLDVHADEDGPYLMDYWPTGEDWMPLPRYSTDIAAAWKVLEELWTGDVLIHVTVGVDPRTEVKIERLCGETWGEWETLVFLEASTAPLAICRAALKFVDIEK